MRIASLFVVALIAACLACAHDRDREGGATEDAPGLHERKTASALTVFEFDVVQRTCAMYVAVRSMALETPIAFDRDLADIPVRWNMCPGGTMVACADVPAAKGDTTRTGIPWPY